MKTRYGIAAIAVAAIAAVGWFSLRSSDKGPTARPQYSNAPEAPSLARTRDTPTTSTAQPAVAQAAVQQAPQAQQGKTVLQASWGDGPGQLGHRRPSEGSPEGPMSFEVDSAGRVHVLDQVNGRIQVFEEGRAVRSIPIGRETFQDIALDGKDGWVLLDRLKDAAIAFVSSDGAMRQVALVGPGVQEGGAVTAMFKRDDGVWVEVEHTELVRVADSKGEADPVRPRAQGRFSVDGAVTTRAMLSGTNSVSVLSQPAAIAMLSPSVATNVSFSEQVAFLAALEFDAKGRTLVIANLVTGGKGLSRGIAGGGREYLEAVVLDASRREVERFTMTTNSGSEEQFRDFRVGANGALYQLSCEDQGATVRRFEQ